MLNATNIWNIGTLDKMGLWGIYITLDLVGLVLCGCLIYAIHCLGKHRTSVDIFIGNLCLGCAWVATTCAISCILNVMHHEFAYGYWACYFEANFRFAGILIQFFSIAAVAWRNYFAVIKEILIPNKIALMIVVIIWTVAIVGTFTFGHYSQIYLMPSGTYCFYTFDSLAFDAWFAPVMVGTLLSICYCYLKIFHTFDQVHHAVVQYNVPTIRIKVEPQRDIEISIVAPARTSERPWIHQRKGSRMPLRVARRSIIYTVLFFFGWGMTVVCSLYNAFAGYIPQGMDAALVILSIMHTCIVPIVYGYSNVRIRLMITGRLSSTHMPSQYACKK